jgi:hypothetical protein
MREDIKFTAKEKRHIRWTFYVETYGSLCCGLVVGAILLIYTNWASTPRVSATATSRVSEWRLAISNDGGVAAYGLMVDVKFDQRITSNDQSFGVFTSRGLVVESDYFFAGQDRASVRADMIPPGATYELIFRFDRMMVSKPEMNIRTAAGTVSEKSDP